MKEGEREKFEKVRLQSLNRIRGILPYIKALEEELSELREEYKDYKRQYEEADRELAENDGRLMRVPIGRRKNKTNDLTIEQIKNIAKQLGVKI